MNLKRFLAVLLALVMLFALAGCVEQEVEPTETTTPLMEQYTKIYQDACAALEQAAQALRPVCHNVCYAANAQANRDAVELLGNCKYLLLAERIGASDVSKMLSLLNTANRLGITVLGFITI